nr:MAG TPA: hypothetical protein [Caudoviricetes sp.]
MYCFFYMVCRKVKRRKCTRCSIVLMYCTVLVIVTFYYCTNVLTVYDNVGDVTTYFISYCIHFFNP